MVGVDAQVDLGTVVGLEPLWLYCCISGGISNGRYSRMLTGKSVSDSTTSGGTPRLTWWKGNWTSPLPSVGLHLVIDSREMRLQTHESNRRRPSRSVP